MWPVEVVLAIYLVKVLVYIRLVAMQKAKEREKGLFPVRAMHPKVDILLPMYNEEKVIVDTIRNLLEINYDWFSIIIVDDGSTDKSFEVVKAHFEGHPQITLLRQPNGGKSAALNRAMSASRSEIVVTIDADTWVFPDAIFNIVQYFNTSKVAAVAGHIKVGNKINLLTAMQYYEYIAIWDHDRAISETVNGILIVPGALGAYRRSAVDAVGGFRSEVIAEDTELTLRLLYNGYELRNAVDAVAFTEAPDNLNMFFRQRVRWTTGLTQGLIKHNKRLFRHSKALAYLILPFTWAFRIILPFLLPLLDYYLLYAGIILNRPEALAWWGGILLMEAAANLFLLAKFKERVNIFQLLLIQRLYRHLLFCNYWLIVAKWFNGTLFQWVKITRKGNIKMEKEEPAPEVVIAAEMAETSTTEP